VDQIQTFTKDALAAFDAFIEIWGVKYDKAAECLIKDRDVLLAFYDFPPRHWKQRMFLEQDRTRHDLKLAETAEKSWRRLRGQGDRISKQVSSQER
jgi:transposase-like protein